MALKESELRVLAILGLVFLILWSFFGLFWSLLIVFTFLIYAYNFGRYRTEKIQRVHATRDSEEDLTFQEKLRDDFPELQDLEFTGLPREKYSLRSPTPLLSVTKRLSFNMSSTTPFQARKAWNNREVDHTPYPGRGSAFGYHRKQHKFSLLNPALQRPSTVKIASPDVTVNRTFTLSNSPLKRATDDWNPCSRVTVLSALKESRKRSFAVVDEEEEELMRPSKRRDTKPVDSYPFSSPLLRGRKRVANAESTETSVDESSNKKGKVVDDSACISSENVCNQSQAESLTQKRKNMDIEREAVNRGDITESTETISVEENSNKKSKVSEQSSEIVHNQRQDDSVTMKRKDVVTETETIKINEDDKESKSKKAKDSEPLTDNEEVKRGRTEYVNEDASSLLKPSKRFTVPRFASKDDSRRRAVPVYCASNEESDMPQRRTVSRKINQEQIKIDRRLAWERVKELLGGDEDEEEEEGGEATKSGTTTVSSAAAASTSSSLFKIPTAGAVTSTVTITTTTTQSLITPAPAPGDPRRTTGAQEGPAISTSGTNPTMQSNTAVAQSQSSTVPSLPSQQALGAGLFSNLSGIPGPSTKLTVGLTTATTQQGQSVSTSLSNPTTIGSQGNLAQISTVTSSQGASEFQFSSLSSFGTSPFTKPATTNQSTVGTNISSAQKAGFSSTAVSSSSVPGTSSSSATGNGQAGFSFTTSTGAQNVFSLGQNSTQNTTGTSSLNPSNTFSLGTNTSQAYVSLANSNLAAASQSPFGALTKPTQSSSVPRASLSANLFGQSANTPQSSLGPTTQNKVTFGATNMQSVTAQQGQSSFGSPFSANGFGAKPTQNTLQSQNSKSSTQSPFTQGTFGANPSTVAFGANPARSAFGAQQQSQQGTPSVFGGQTANSAFSIGAKTNPATPQGGFGTQPSQNTFGTQQTTTQNLFGIQATQNAFGSQPNQNATQNAFGARPTQNAFGAQPNQQTTQTAFVATSNQKAFESSKSSPFTFGANTSQNVSNSPFGGFGNKAGTQNAFGVAPSQNAAAPSGGFNFSAPANNPTPAGFNFSAAANKTGGFQFGPPGGSSSFGQFGQTTAQPGPAPATPAPSGGFNFAPGGMAGSPFASPTPAPAFGAPSTPQGAGSTLTARSRPRLTARRRGKK